MINPGAAWRALFKHIQPPALMDAAPPSAGTALDIEIGVLYSQWLTGSVTTQWQVP